MFPYPKDEFERYDVLPEFDIEHALAQVEYRKVVALTADVLGFPIVCFCIVGIAELTVVASTGIEPQIMPRDVAICSHTIASDTPLVVTDLTLDDRFRTNPFVTNDPHVRFYAGTTICSSEGIRLGTLCVMDREPRDLDDAAMRLLQRLGETIADRLEARRLHLRDKKAIECRLYETEELCRSTLRLAHLIPWRANSRGRIVDVGRGWQELTGFPCAELLNMSWINHIHPEDVEAFFAKWRETIRSGAAFQAEMRLSASSGDYLWCRIRATPAHDDACRITGWYGLIENIEGERAADTRLQAMQAQITHASRMSAMETMASTLAHELNQPLAAITQYVSGSRRMIANADHPQSPAIVEALDEAASAALRAGEIVRSARELVARGEVQRRRQPVAALIEDAVRAAFSSPEMADIEHRIEIAPDVSSVLVDATQIQQVLINLLRNAGQALENMPKRMIVVSAVQVSDDQCALTVSDTGPGIAEDVAARLFSPFNTSKGDGMGIGLSISRTIIEAHDGQISVTANQGGGATFRFTLPAG